MQNFCCTTFNSKDLYIYIYIHIYIYIYIYNIYIYIYVIYRISIQNMYTEYVIYLSTNLVYCGVQKLMIVEKALQFERKAPKNMT